MMTAKEVKNKSDGFKIIYSLKFQRWLKTKSKPRLIMDYIHEDTITGFSAKVTIIQ